MIQSAPGLVIRICSISRTIYRCRNLIRNAEMLAKFLGGDIDRINYERPVIGKQPGSCPTFPGRPRREFPAARR